MWVLSQSVSDQWTRCPNFCSYHQYWHFVVVSQVRTGAFDSDADSAKRGVIMNWHWDYPKLHTAGERQLLWSTVKIFPIMAGIINYFAPAYFSWHGYNKACYSETEMSSIRYTPLAAEATRESLNNCFFFLFFYNRILPDSSQERFQSKNSQPVSLVAGLNTSRICLHGVAGI